MLEIKNLTVSINSKIVLNNLNLKIEEKSFHAIMGPNGSGKTTLSRVIAGDSNYSVIEGEIYFQKTNLLELDIETRVKLGIFMGFQNPVEIQGVSNFTFLQSISNLNTENFKNIIQKKLDFMKIDKDFLKRDLNHGFSGGEKKKNEILQMMLLDPKMSILDEIDSGVDIDSLCVIAGGIKEWFGNGKKSLILITHYLRLLNCIRPDFIHIMMNGKIIESGDYLLAKKLEEKGYEYFKK